MDLAHCGPAAEYTHIVSPLDPTRLAKPGELDRLRGECALPAASLAMLRGSRPGRRQPRSRALTRAAWRVRWSRSGTLAAARAASA